MMRTGAHVPSPLLYCRAIIAKDYIPPQFSEGCTTLTYNCSQPFQILGLKQLFTAAAIICSLENPRLSGVGYLHILSQAYKS